LKSFGFATELWN